VLHFGFVDSPFSVERTKEGNLLHQRLQSVAGLVYGLDIDAQSIDAYRKLTGDRENSFLDIQKSLPQVDFLSRDYEVILFGEILEHLLYPAAAMANLLRICQLNPRARLCITVPNAYSAMAFFTALCGDELVHPDHYYYFSPMTLGKLIRDTGFMLGELYQYGDRMTLGSPGITKHGLIALCEVARQTQET
jgi:2-polyprenyl-3-methyl-5-hydroxy-6-metoxy-1,4-benzoquinol methylase